MEKQPFYFEIEDQIKMFLSALDGCIVRRYRGRTPADAVSVRYIYGPKQRALHDLVNKAQHITLPAAAFVIKSISLDKTRLWNKLEGSEQFLGGTLRNIPHPLPVNIELELSILTRFQTDMDQIISNMFAYFQDYIVISWNRMDLPYNEIRSKVKWAGNVGLTYPVDITDDKATRVDLQTNFTIEGWIFKKDENPSGIIKNIEASFAAIDRISNNIVDLESQRTAENTESFTVSGVPHIVSVYPYAVNAGSAIDVNVYGSFIRGISSAYLSSNVVYPGVSSTYFDPFSAYPTLSADNPGFSAIKVDFTINNESSITVNLPAPLSAGFIDVIFLNSVGYGKLTLDTASPYASGIAVYALT